MDEFNRIGLSYLYSVIAKHSCLLRSLSLCKAFHELGLKKRKRQSRRLRDRRIFFRASRVDADMPRQGNRILLTNTVVIVPQFDVDIW